MTNRLVVAFPLYRQLPVPWFQSWLQMDKSPVIGIVSTEALAVPVAMQQLVDQTFDNFGTEWDRIVLFEHDMLCPQDAFLRIAQYGDEHDIVGSLYFMHQKPHHVMAWMQAQPPHFSPLTAEVIKTMVEKPALYRVDGVATGFTAIKRQVFEQWDKSIPLWYPEDIPAGHDFHFCNHAKRQGFKIWLDSGLECRHLTLVPIGYSHSQAELQSWAPGS